MSDYFGKYFGARDVGLIQGLNQELYDDVVQNVVFLYKIAAAETNTNIYGETDSISGKSFYPSIAITALIEHPDIDTDDSEGFGPDRNQSVVFKFRKIVLDAVGFMPQVGDIVEFNNRFHECDNIVIEQFLGGQSNKSFSVIANTHYSRLSKLNIISRQN